MHRRLVMVLRICSLFVILAGVLFPPQSSVFAAPILKVEPITWNTVGLDSNNVNVGPNRFPVGARVCNTGDAAATGVTARFVWDDGYDAFTNSANPHPYINLRSGTLDSIDLGSVTQGSCATVFEDAYFEVEIKRDSNAYNQTRRYHIEVTSTVPGGTVSTATPRELFVEHLVSQSRNAVTNMYLDGNSVPAGGTMNLFVGQTYTITLEGYTATQGYEQIEYFINFPNTIFQILSVSSTFTADSSASVGPSPMNRLYGDNCRWENNPNSLNYRTCLDAGKTGGNVTTTYEVKILKVPGAPLVNPEPLSTLIYDFSGSSFHYNADFGVSTRYANIISPATITKSFEPTTIVPNASTTLKYVITNSGSSSLSDINFADVIGTPGWPSGLTVAGDQDSSVMYAGCGSPLPNTVTNGTAGISFSNITVAANSACTITVNVTAAANGTYTNTTNNLYIGTLDTGGNAAATLLVSSIPSLSGYSCGTSYDTLAHWDFDSPTAGGIAPNSPLGSGVTTASASTSTSGSFSTTTAQGNGGYSWSGSGWPTTGVASPVPALNTATTTHYQFTADTSNYTDVRIVFDHFALGGDWAAPGNNFFYFYVSSNGGAFSSGTSLSLTKGNTWTLGNTYAAPTTGTASTTFAISAAGAKAGKFLYIDKVRIEGCKRPNPPTLSKAFNPTTIGVDTSNPATVVTNSFSTLTFMMTNPNTAALTGVEFTDTLPSGLVVANPASTSSSCTSGTLAGTITAATGSGTISLSGGTIAGGATCTLSVHVQGRVTGNFTNRTTAIKAEYAGANTGGAQTGYGEANLTVITSPAISKSFGVTNLLTGESTELTFTITNPGNIPMTNVSFTDPVPAGLDVTAASESQCGGTLTADAALDTISLTNGSIDAGGSCTFSVTVTGTTVSPAAGYTNTTDVVTATVGGSSVSGNRANATVVVRNASPDVSLLKQVGPTASGPWTSFLAVNTPDTVFFRFLVENTGDIALEDINVTDTDLPAGAPSPSTCSWVTPLPVADANDRHIAVCVLGPVTISSAPTPNPYINTATVTTSTYSPTTPVTSSARYGTTGLSLAKSASPVFYDSAGDAISYNYVVTNTGNTNLQGPVTVVDNKVATVTCPSVGGDNLLTPEESITCTATYTIQDDDVSAGFVTNIASASVDGITSNSDSATVNQARPDLTVDKTNNVSGTVAQTASFTWTLTVSNVGTADAVFTDGQTILSDPLPLDANYNPIILVGGAIFMGPVDCSISGGILTCTANGGNVTIPSGDSFTVELIVTPTAAASLANTATVDPNGNITEGNETNNTSLDTVNVTAVVDLSLDKQVSYATPNVGSTVTFTLGVTNAGPGTASNIVVTDIVPSGYTYVGSSIAGGTSRDASDPTGSGLTWTISSLASGASTNLTYQVTVLGAGNYDNYAEITSHTEIDADSTPGDASTTQDDDDTEAVTPIVFTPADLTVTKTNNAANGWVASGGIFQWTITARNGLTAGTASFANGDVILSDSLPTGQAYGAVTVTNGTTAPTGTIDCSITGTTLSCVANGVVTLPADASFTVSFNVMTSGNANLPNTATIDPGGKVTESNELNNTGSNTVYVFDGRPSKLLATTSEPSTSGSRVTLGEMVRYRIAARIPEGDFASFQLVDNIPSGLQYVNDGMARFAFVSNGAGVTSSTLTCVNDTGNAFDLVSLTSANVDCALTGAISGGTGNGVAVIFSLGNISNADIDADPEYAVVEFNALVLNVNTSTDINQGVDNQTGTLNNNFRPNDATLRVNNATVGLNSTNVTVNIAEPAITNVAKSVSAGPYLPGNPVTYTLTFSNVSSSLTNAATAFDVVLTDTLNANLTPGAVNVSSTQGGTCLGGTTFTTSNSTNGQDVTVNISCLDPDQSVTVTINATINAGTAAGTNILNTGNVTYSSLPGAQGDCSTSPFTCAGVGNSGTATGERTGFDGAGADTSVLNNYSDSGTVSFTVASADLLPVAAPDTNTATESGPAVNGDLLTNETSLGNTPTTVTASDQGGTVITLGVPFTTAAGGSLTLNDDGSYSYIPPVSLAEGNVLTEVFNYTITDVDGDTSSGTLTITVDRLPLAAPDVSTATEGGAAATGNVMTNDDEGNISATVTAADQGGTAITFGSPFTTAAGASLTLNANGTYSYTPPASLVEGTVLTEVFNYTFTDADGDTSSSTLTITVDRLPLAVADTRTVTEGGTNATGNVITNDDEGNTSATVTAADQGGNMITIGSAFTTAAGGTITLNSNGTYTYVPPATLPEGGSLTEVFNYAIVDADGDTSSSTLTITVDRLPQANPDANTATEGGANAIGNIITNDDEGNTNATISAANQGGTAITIGSASTTSAGGTLILNVDGTYTYSPPATLPEGAVLTEVFSYTLRDKDGDTSSSTLTITVDRLPQAVPDTNTATEGGPNATGNVIANDDEGNTSATVTAIVDDDGDPLTFGVPFTTDGGGTLTLNGDGTYTYTPPVFGTVPPGGLSEVFTYTITDADGDTSTSTLTITVDDNDRLPDAVADINTATEGGANATGNLLTNENSLGDTPTIVTAVVDDDGNPLALGTPFATDGGGSLTINADGTYTYTPPASLPEGDLLIEVFTYTITDVDGDTDSATLTITVDRLPQANLDTNTATEGGTDVTGSVITNDDEGNLNSSITLANQGGSTITIGQPFTTTAGGSLTLNGDGTYTYTPPATLPEGAVLTEEFNYTITDADGDTSSSTLTITVDRLPHANPDTNTASEGGLNATGNVINNDDEGNVNANVTAANQGGSSITMGLAFTTAAGGSLTINVDGSYTYTPPAINLVPPGGVTEVFNYTITDTDGDISSSTLTITVDDNDQIPLAVANTNTATENGPAVNGNVLTDDALGDTPTTVTSVVDDDGNPLTLGIPFATDGGGSLTINGDGTYAYTPPVWDLVPPAGLVEVFTYTITDVDGDTDTTTLTITVNDDDRLPLATDNSYTINEGATVIGNVMTDGTPDTLGDPPATVTAYDSTSANGGTVTIAGDGSFTYDPNGFVGTDTFTYTITDKDGDVSTATVTVTITDLPDAIDDSDTTGEGAPVTTNVLINDDPGTPPTTITAHTDGSNGSVSCTATGCTYVPDAGFTGTDTYTYTITDANDNTDTATVTITVIDLPDAINDSDSTDEGTPVTTNVLTNDDLGVGPTTITSHTQGTNGAVTCTASNCTYAPVSGFTGTDTYTYTITDSNGNSDTATVTILVVDLPDAIDDSDTTDEGTPVTTNVLTNDDAGAAPTTITSHTQGTNGSVTCTATNCTYTPAAGFTGTDTYTYTITDANGNTDTATVTVTILDLPDAVNDSDTTDQNTPVTTNVLTNDDLGTAPTTITSNTDGTNGSVTCTAIDCTYSPDPGFSGTDTYTYTITDANGNSDTATVTITVDLSRIGIAKRIVSTTEISSGTYDVTYDLYVENFGTTTLNNIQVTDSLSTTFAAPTTFTVRSLTSDDFTVNAGYNGSGDTNLLAGTDNLASGANGNITLVVRVFPVSAGPFNNVAISSGQCPTCNTPVTDQSQDGSDPDPDHDDDPTNDNDPTPLTFGPNLFDPPFGLKVVDASGIPLLQWTMVWINDPNIVAIDAQVADPIPAGTSFVAGSLTCTASGVTTTNSCFYELPSATYPRGRVIWNGDLGPDLNATDAASAANEITITFNVNVSAGITSVQNTATIDADLNGNNVLTDPGEQIVASASSSWSAASAGSNRISLPATGFAPHVVTDLSNVPHESYTAAGDVTVEIPGLNIKLPIVGVPKKDGTWNVSWLGNQAGWLEGTAFPSWSGNSVLTSHVYLSNGLPGPFINLGKLKYGDKIVIHAYGQKYTFEVRENKVVEPDDTSVMKHEEKSWLTLITCKEYDPRTNTYRKRVVVRAVLISVAGE